MGNVNINIDKIKQKKISKILFRLVILFVHYGRELLLYVNRNNSFVNKVEFATFSYLTSVKL